MAHFWAWSEPSFVVVGLVAGVALVLFDLYRRITK